MLKNKPGSQGFDASQKLFGSFRKKAGELEEKNRRQSEDLDSWFEKLYCLKRVMNF